METYRIRIEILLYIHIPFVNHNYRRKQEWQNKKREINEEFADVWSEIVSERVEVVKLPTA